jgi:2-polyprenyl-3-methyl-5-hydroxy-6-metoxy-1,4-benzoquinol methylase
MNEPLWGSRKVKFFDSKYNIQLKQIKTNNMSQFKEMFSNTYTYNRWGSSESLSGEGSEWVYANGYANNLIRIINQYQIKTIFDTSCGDWNWMKKIKEHLPNYIGNDVVESVIQRNTELYTTDTIRFKSGDMVENLSKEDSIDLVICRHTLEHLPTYYCIDFCNEVVKKAKYAIITSMNWNDVGNSELTPNGVSARAINLDKEPYLSILGEPIERIWDHTLEPGPIGTFGYLYKFE